MWHVTADDPRLMCAIHRCRVTLSLSDETAAARLRRVLSESVVGTRFAPTGDTGGDGDDRPTVVFSDIPRSADPKPEQEPPDSGSPATIFVIRGEPDSKQWSEATRLGARRLICSEMLDDRRCVTAAIEAALRDPWRSDPASWGSGQEYKTTEIESADSRDTIIRDLLGELGAHPLWSESIDLYRLVAEELVNNALLHAFETDRDRRYVPGSFDRMLDGDRVSVRHEINDEVFWLAVTDNAGTLAGARILAHIQRHLETAGLLDGGGRGLFIAFALANVLAVNIDRGRSTEVSVVFLAGRPETHKLVLINTHPES